MLFKQSFWLTSLFILYVHEHDRLDFGMFTVEIAVFPGCIWLHLLIKFQSRQKRSVLSGGI